MKQQLMLVVTAALLAVSVATNANQANTETAAAPARQAPAAANNFFDPTYWNGVFAAGAQQPAISDEIAFNAAQPSAWMQWVDPQTHGQMHQAFANPATWMQFMRADFYMQFTKAENMQAWMDPAWFQAMTNPQTMNYWMNPANYMHAVDAGMYQQTMNPANYMVYLNPNTYTSLMQATACDSENGGAPRGFFGFGC